MYSDAENDMLMKRRLMDKPHGMLEGPRLQAYPGQKLGYYYSRKSPHNKYGKRKSRSPSKRRSKSKSKSPRRKRSTRRTRHRVQSLRGGDEDLSGGAVETLAVEPVAVEVPSTLSGGAAAAEVAPSAAEALAGGESVKAETLSGGAVVEQAEVVPPIEGGKKKKAIRGRR
jgi:hypothetical protein